MIFCTNVSQTVSFQNLFFGIALKCGSPRANFLWNEIQSRGGLNMHEYPPIGPLMDAEKNSVEILMK